MRLLNFIHYLENTILIAKIEAKDYESIGEIIIHKIKTIEGITDTKTLTGIKLH